MLILDLVLWAYAASLGILCLYGVQRLLHLAQLRREEFSAGHAPKGRPEVLVQLPLYNERAVAARVLGAVAKLEWPQDRLRIQVLDDSTDETSAIVDDEVRRLRSEGLRVQVLRRGDRDGYKAGALARGLEVTRAPFVAIFDADFLPEPDFLMRTMGAFEDPAIGLVQARWHHQNRDESLLTRAQATLLDGHFVIEHQARFAAGHCFNFNGTAGVWRRAAIQDGGGWSGDTLTEDLDLSYRAQLAGWRFVYVWGVTAPAELPADAAAFLAQQARWARGSIQVLRKLFRPLLRSRLPLRTKLEAIGHLLGNGGQPALLLLALCLPFVAQERAVLLGPLHAVAFVLCTLAVLLFYETSQRLVGRPWGKRVVDVFSAMALGIGMCLRQSRAVFLGVFGGRGVFERTPKRGARERAPYRARLAGSGWMELVLCLVYCWTALRAWQAGAPASVPFLALFAWGFGWVGVRSLKESRRPKPAISAQAAPMDPGVAR